MLDKLKKAAKQVFTAQTDEVMPILAEVINEDIKLDSEGMQAEFSALKTSFDSQASVLGKLTEEFSKLQAEASNYKQELDAALSLINSLEKENKDTKMSARKSVVEASIGTEKAGAFLAATEGLDDAAFNAIASALASSLEVEANSPMFKEVGVTGKTQGEHVANEETKEMKILKKKYAKKQ